MERWVGPAFDNDVRFMQGLSVHTFDIFTAGSNMFDFQLIPNKIQLNADKEKDGTLFHGVNRLPINCISRGKAWALISPAGVYGTLSGTINAEIVLG